MSVTISEALQQAQDSIGSGNYRAAVSTCAQLVQQFPNYAAAHRLLGEAWLEQGQNGEAERAFTAALSGNPRHPWAYLGLGLIAEDRGANDPALAFTQVAWELAPNVAQLREPVRRTAMRRYGSDGQLQFTRAALAQLHANNARLQRAAAEYRAALAELPDRIDLQLGYAEVLWRLGQDADAANLCRELLEHHQDAVQALVILADIEHRGGDARRADAWLSRVRAVDPDGAVVSVMLAANPRADRDWLGVADDAIPIVVEGAVAAQPDMPHFAPAPDFEYVPSRPEGRTANIADLRPMELEEFGGDVPADLPAADAGFLLEDFDEQPFDPADLGGDALGSAGSALGGAASGLGVAAVAGIGLAAAAFHDRDDAGDDAQALDEIAPLAVAADQPWTAADDDELSSLAAALEDDVASALNRTGSSTLDAIIMASEDPADNLPPDIAPAGYTTMLRELGDEGLAPFDALDQSMPAPELSDDVLEAELAGLSDMDMPTPPVAPSSDDMEALQALANDWDAIDNEIQSAVPADVPHGYTDELRSLEGIGLEPFDVDDEAAALAPAAAAGLIAADLFPISKPAAEAESESLTDAQMDELWLAESPAAQAAVEEEQAFESLLSEEPVQADSELEMAGALEQDMVDAEPVALEMAVVAEAAPDVDTGLAYVVSAEPDLAAIDDVLIADDAVFADLEPFAAEDFDQGPLDLQTKPFAFGPAPWDTDGQSGVVRSAVPSDEDLDVLLAAEEAQRAEAHDALLADVSPAEMPEPVSEHAPEIIAEPATPEVLNTDDLPTRDLPSGWDTPATSWTDQEELQDMFGSSLAVTRALGATEEPPAEPEWTAPAAVVAEPMPEPEAVAESLSDSVDDIHTDAGVFDRARAGKNELIEVGVITGNLELQELEQVDEAEVVEAAAEPEFELEADVDPVRVTGTGAFKDADTLRAALAADPDDAELHWWLAQALQERGDVADAIGEYRWLVRNAPDRTDAVIGALNACLEAHTETELAHRVLADIYRRRGDSARASRHAAMSLQSHRRTRG